MKTKSRKCRIPRPAIEDKQPKAGHSISPMHVTDNYMQYRLSTLENTLRSEFHAQMECIKSQVIELEKRINSIDYMSRNDILSTIASLKEQLNSDIKKLENNVYDLDAIAVKKQPYTHIDSGEGNMALLVSGRIVLKDIERSINRKKSVPLHIDPSNGSVIAYHGE